jgi:hypothetical protein
VDDGDDSHEDDSDKEEADVEGADADEDVDEDADEGKSEVIYELLTLNPLSNVHPASSLFWL